MHTRQSGAAHVPILFFLMLLVLFLGALGFGYATLTKNNDLETQLAQARGDARVDKGKIRLMEHYIDDTGALFKVPGKYAGRPNVSVADDYANQTLDGVSNVMDLSLVRQTIDNFARQAEVSNTSSLDGLFGGVIAALDAKKQRIGAIESERDKLATEKSTIDASFARSGAEHSQAQSTLRDQLTQNTQQFNTQLADKDNRLETTRQNLREKIDELRDERDSRIVERKDLQGEIGKMRGHTTALISKLAMKYPPDVADGKILASRNNVASAWITLGRKDMLQPGTIFRVRNANSDKVKAYATVARVEQERAEVTLHGVVDPVGDQVREGDELFNDLYSPNVSRNVYLMGRFSYPYNKPELEKLLQNLGNRIHHKMEPGVDLVLLGNASITEEGDGFVPVSETPEYKEALNLGVEFAPLHKIRDLIKL